MEIARKITFVYVKVRKQNKKTKVWPITICAFEVKKKRDIITFDSKWDQYPLEVYYSPQPYFDNIGMVQHLVGKKFVHEGALEDHWMNLLDDYDVQIRDYCRMTLYLEEKELKMNIPLKFVEKDMKYVIDPLYNRGKIYDRMIMNLEISRDENVDINNKAYHIVQLAREWIKKHFNCDLIL